MEFSDILKDRFLSGQSNQFVLYNNVKDLYLYDDKYITLIEYLNNFFCATDRIQIRFNIAEGISFVNKKDELIIKNTYKAFSEIGGSVESRERWFSKALVESAMYPQVGIKFIEECLKLKIEDKNNNLRPFSIIIDYADTIAPNGPLNRLTDVDRQKIVTISSFLTKQKFLNSNNLIIFITDTLSSFNDMIINLPSMTLLDIPRPNYEMRLNYIKFQYKFFEKKVKLNCSRSELAMLTAGLTLKGIEHLFLYSNYSKEKLDKDKVLKKTNEILKKELGDVIEIFTPTHDLKAVIGASKLKKHLKNQKTLIMDGNPELSPVGILVSGPNGVGKTYIFEAFALEVNFNIIKFKKMRSQWFGETDVIFEKIKSVLTSLGKVIVLIDEADTAFGGRGQSTHDTEKRLFGNLIQMMGDPKNRGKIIWILITARPDKLEPDIKRSGRAGLHLPVFDPEGEEKNQFIKWIFKNIGFNFDKFNKNQKDKFFVVTKDYSPADYNELSVILKSNIVLNKNKVNTEALIEIIEDFRPTSIKNERRYQTLLAANECSFKSLLPDDLKNTQNIQEELELLKRNININ